MLRVTMLFVIQWGSQMDAIVISHRRFTSHESAGVFADDGGNQMAAESQ